MRDRSGTMIFVFSGTGNSYEVAQRISERLGTKMVDVARLVRYRQYVHDAKGEPVGFVFPTYYCGLPRMVDELARNLTVLNPGRTFAVATCGEESGGACDMLQEDLGDRLRVDAFYDIVMPDNSVFAFDPPTKEQAEETLRRNDGEIAAIADSISRGEKGDFRQHVGDKDWREIYRLYDEQRVTEPFTVTDRCVECKICAELCPEQIIKFYHRRPVWDEEKCSLCMGCVQMCPYHAIEYGEATASRGRYYNPAFYEKTLGIRMEYSS